MLPRQTLPDWMKPELDLRFNDLARITSKLDDVDDPLCQKQSELERQFKKELTLKQFKLILDWEEIMNYRHAIEMEWIYRAGLRDGMQMGQTFYTP